MIYMMGMREKPRNIQKDKQRKKFPIWLPSHSPVYKNRGRLFSGVQKQAGPTLGGTGILVLWDKEIQGWVRDGQIKAGNLIFIHVNFQDLLIYLGIKDRIPITH